jgi:hypothetical protein
VWLAGYQLRSPSTQALKVRTDLLLLSGTILLRCGSGGVWSCCRRHGLRACARFVLAGMCRELLLLLLLPGKPEALLLPD